jgi:hypothetical protein
MTAFAEARERTVSVPSRAVLLIGVEPLERTIRHLFASSHWTLMREGSLNRALELVESVRIPVVVCDEADVEGIETAASQLDSKPLVIALSRNQHLAPGIHACGRSAFLMNAHRIAAGEWFSLLNQAWRTNERSGL